MSRPTLPAASERRAVARNLALDLVAGVGIGVTIAVVTALLPTIARRGGIEPVGLAALAAAPFVANLLGAFAGRVGPRSPGQLALLRGGGAAALLVLLVVGSPLVMVGATLLFWTSLSFGGPFYLRLWGTMYPSRILGRLIGVVGMVRAAAGALTALAGGLIADRLGGETAVALGGAIGVLCALAYAGLRAGPADPPAPFSARTSIRTLRERPVLARVALAQGFYGGGLIAAVPLFALVHVDRLDLSLADVGVIGILHSLATTIAFPPWGMAADRHGGLAVMRLGSVVGTAALIGYALAPHVGVLWLAGVGAGIAGAAIDVAVSQVIAAHTTLDTRAAAMAGWNAVTGARGVVAAFLMSALLQVGVVDVTTGLLACAAAAMVGVVLFARTDARPRPVEAPATDPAPRGAVPAPAR